jgi:hypothetical protein
MRRTQIILFTALLAAFAALGASASGAGITVFKTSFDSRADYESIKTLNGGKQCKRDWRDEKALGVTVTTGPVACAASSPVSGDGPQADQTVRVVAKVNKETDDKVKETMYVGAIVRASSRGSYELRVYPKARRFELLKSGEVLEDGREKSIEGLATKNRLEITAVGSTVTVKVNGDALASFKDKDADQVQGRQTGLVWGNAGRSKKGVGKALFDKLKVQIPSK